MYGDLLGRCGGKMAVARLRGVKIWREELDWTILARHFLVWFVHGLELLQQEGGSEDVGRSWRRHMHTSRALDLHIMFNTDLNVFSALVMNAYGRWQQPCIAFKENMEARSYEIIIS